MATRIRTLNFLPEIFKTPTNSQFFSATLDHLVSQPNLKKIEGYIGSKFGYGVNANSKYVVEPSISRVNYQLDPGVVLLGQNGSVQDFISYPGIIDSLNVSGGVTADHNRMFASQFYAWDSFVDLDKIINFNQYYWAPSGLPAVTVAVDSIFDSESYIVTDNTIGYSISSSGDTTSASNPTITLLRGGVYTFAVNQGGQFWIQGEPGVTGFSKTMPNVQTREITGVQNNGQTVGLVTFTVPNKDAQDGYNFPGNNLVDLVTSTPFELVNGARVSDLNNIDSVTSLEGRTLMFYNTGIPNEQGYISTFYDAAPYDITTILTGTSVTVTSSSSSTDEFTCNSTALLRVGQTITFTGSVFGGVSTYQTAIYSPVAVTAVVASTRYFITTLGDTDFTLIGAPSNDIGVIFEATGAGTGTGTATLHNPSLYYVSEIVSSTTFKISEMLNGSAVALSNASGSMTAAINQGLYEGGYFTEVNSCFYTITYVTDDIDNPIIRLVPGLAIPSLEKITAVYGNQWISRTFYKAADGEIYTIPYFSALLDTLYYQDSLSGNKVGTIKLIDSNISNTLNVADDILGKVQYTSPNGVVFTNGLKVTFAGDIAPAGYVGEQFYVEGVGTSIELILVSELVAAEVIGNGEYIPYDSMPYDSTSFDSSLYVPVTADYITIARNAIDRNAWSRSNRWVHSDVINATAKYNNDPSVISTYTTHDAKARRPVIEFYPNLKLFQSGILGKSPIDFIDFVTTDAFVQVEGKTRYFPDVSVSTTYTASIEGVSEKITSVLSTSVTNTVTCRSTSGFSPADAVKVVGPGFGGLTENTLYYINAIIDETTMVLTDEFGDILLLSDATGSVSLYGITTSSSDTIATRFPNVVVCDSTSGMRVDDKIIFTGTMLGGLVANTVYYIESISEDSAITVSATKHGEAIPVTTDTGSMDITVIPMSTVITLPLNSITGTFKVGHYVVDTDNILPANTRITSITKSSTEMTLTVHWDTDTYGEIQSVTGVSLRATEGNSDNYSVFDGARIVFAADSNPEVRDKVYTVRLSRTDLSAPEVITLSEASDGQTLPNEMLFVYRGYSYGNKDFYFDGSDWLAAQQKNRVNQPPMFDVLDHNGKSLGDQSIYLSSSFKGTTLFSYGTGTGSIDPILGFPIRYSSVDNVGDISFDITLNSDEFKYVADQQSLTAAVNTGYVHRYSGLNDYTRSLGWQTTVAPSAQRQVFEFTYTASLSNSTFVCDVAASVNSEWPSVQVYINNVILDKTAYTVTVGSTTTTVAIVMPNPSVDTVVQLVILSDQVSKTGYYKIPVNLNNNPLNTDVTQVNVGDIRLHFQSIYANAPGLTGAMLGANNYRDSGSLVKYGDAIVQHSASLALPGALLRKQNHSLFDALRFNASEYVNFKTLLANTVAKNVIAGYPTAAEILDSAIDMMSVSKNEDSPFFWSDMLPAKAAHITNTYAFANSLDTSIYPLNRIYDYSVANYFGVIVYLTRIIDGVVTIRQLVLNKEYTIDSQSPSVTVSIPLVPGDRVEIREYTQTYGNFVPNTPTKLGLYPATIPEIRLDNAYSQPTYFIVGHDGSYTRLYGNYDPLTAKLDDYRDQALLEFELRVFNNLKTSSTIPLTENDIMPGFFRKTLLNVDEVTDMYSSGFLNWIGQNRIDYQTQQFSQSDPYSFNYSQSQNKLDKSLIQFGHWRGLYEYLFDTSNPAVTPWEMIGLTNKPDWFDSHYGEAPYTKDNLVLWGDMEAGINYNNGAPYVVEYAVRPGLSRILPVDSAGNLLSPFESVIGNYVNQSFIRSWKVGDSAPAEYSYKRSSTWPFDLMKLFALTKPAAFFNLAVDLDNYKYNSEFDQYLVNDRSHLVLKNIEVYGTGIAKTSYLNWIVDYEKQTGISATSGIEELFNSIDVRLVYRLAGFSDKNLLKFYVEKSSTNSNNNTLLIPDESYAVLLYDNQPASKITYSSVIVQLTDRGYKVFGNSQSIAYFTTLKPIINGNYSTVHIDNLDVQLAKAYDTGTTRVPYGTEFSSVQELSQFLASYGKYLESLGVKFDQITAGIPITWEQMVAEFMYWAQTGWEVGSVLNLNPAADTLTIDKDSQVVQPLTIRDKNFVLNQNMYPILATDMAVVREGTKFEVQALKTGDSISYGEFNLSNIEHAVVFDNVTVFGDRIYNLVTGLRQDRITLRGTKTAEWNGTVDAQGFILNLDNVEEWNNSTKYTAGSIVTYKNKYWTATKIVQAAATFNEKNWKHTDYDQVQKGLLPNPSTRSFESTIYYDSNRTNLENDADLLSFSLIGYRPRNYLAVADLTDITQVNVYKNLIKSKGTPNAANAFKGATLAQGGIDYSIHENWAIKTGEFGGVMNSNYVEFRLDEHLLTSNPNIVSLNSGEYTDGSHQEVSIKKLYNYGRPISTHNILSVIDTNSAGAYETLPSAGYVNTNDVKIMSYYYSGLTSNTVPLSKLNVWDNIWLADYSGTWQVSTPLVAGQVTRVTNFGNGFLNVEFDKPHSLSQYQAIAIVSFDPAIDNYYSVSSILGASSVQVRATINSSIRELTGKGICFSFDSVRVSKPSDIESMPLLNNEFDSNTVWVDTDTTGQWAVYRKKINYALNKTITGDESYADRVAFQYPTTPTASGKFGTAVAYTKDLGYLVGDPAAGEAYRYSYNSLRREYTLSQIITHGSTFGGVIEHAGDTFVFSYPTDVEAPLNVYRLVNTTLVDRMLPLNTGLHSASTSFTGPVAISGDRNWIYATVGDGICAFVKSPVTGHYSLTLSSAVQIVPPVDSIGFGYSLTTNYAGDMLVVGAPQSIGPVSAPVTNWGKSYVYSRTVQNFEVQFNSIPFVPQLFPLTWAPAVYVISVTGTAGPDASVSSADLTIGNEYTIEVVGTTDWTLVGAINNLVGEIFIATGGVAGTGTALATPAIFSSAIDTSAISVLQPVVFSPGAFGGLSENTVYFIKTVSATQFTVATNRLVAEVVATGGVNTSITVADTTGFEVGQPVKFYGYSAGVGLTIEQLYFIESIISSTEFTITESVGGSTLIITEPVNDEDYPVYMTMVTLSGSMSGMTTLTATMTADVQVTPMVITRNGTVMAESAYAVEGSTLRVFDNLVAGDILTVSGNNFAMAQTLTTQAAPRASVQFGNSVSITSTATEILVGAPFALDGNKEGAVYRYTNVGMRYGSLVSTSTCYVSSPVTILLNGYRVNLPIGGAASIAAAINSANITNILAYSPDSPVLPSGQLDPNYGILTISLVDIAQSTPNNKLSLAVLDSTTLDSLGMTMYTQTQVITDPHAQRSSQFGSKIKFNEFDSFVVSAPTSTRFVATTFDFIDNSNTGDDLIFDNNATRWVDSSPAAGAVYMFDYLANHDESLSSLGKFVYAQSINDLTLSYGLKPNFGSSLEFNDNTVVIGAPDSNPASEFGRVVSYYNTSGAKDWSVHRAAAATVDVDRVKNIQLYSADTNETLDNLDYIDPLNGKLLGSVQENIDVISNQDPAGYTTTESNSGAMVWAADKVGYIWFDTSATKFLNYHQPDMAYNSVTWGKIFPGSDVRVYTWVASSTPPTEYSGPGTPYSTSNFTTSSAITADESLAPVYYFWVKNTSKVFTAAGKTLADTIIQSYIANPQLSGISYFMPLAQNVFGLANCNDSIHSTDTVLHIGFSTSESDDPSHSSFSLIRSDYRDDFLPGLPSSSNPEPSSLYSKLLDSLCGVSDTPITPNDNTPEQLVPNPYLPKAVQTGILSRPNQSFFVNRYLALQNYLEYANDIIAQHPITETKHTPLLHIAGENVNTTDYWEYISWWATGYNDTTKSVLQVSIYADLFAIKANEGLIVTVAANGSGLAETYIYQSHVWRRIGLQHGTIKFKQSLWDYPAAGIGFGDSFFDTTPYAEFPSHETRNIIRSLTEEIFTDELTIHRNKSLILLFEYIQSETNELHNYLPWLNKTSFVDVSHTIRELLPVSVYRDDNQSFLEGYLNEVKPYHVVVKDFIFKYHGTNSWQGDVTDFDLPAQYDSTIDQFVTPSLVYSNPSMVSNKLSDDSIWENGEYTEWYKNHGLSLTGIDSHPIALLTSSMVLNTAECSVDNAFGFPVTGFIQIDDEIIAYSSVDRNRSMLYGLSRGANGTAITTHNPGAQIVMDIPAVLLLNGGRGYTTLPTVTASFDLDRFPVTSNLDVANTVTGFRPAILSAVMQFDTIMRIDVIDPGAGYPVTPDIMIQPAAIVSFNSTEVQLGTNTIRIYNTSQLYTGDLVRYVSEDHIGGVSSGEYYYIGVLDTAPTLVVSLYTTYANAINDTDRVVFLSAGSGTNYLEVGGKASCVTSALPIRENSMTLRFDRTTYSSDIVEWTPGSFYSAGFAGEYDTPVTFETTRPPITTIFAGAPGAAFAVVDITPTDVISWSSSSRGVVSILAPGSITLKPNEFGAPDSGTVGPTLGLHAGMPIKFTGMVSGGIVSEQEYYVAEVVSDTDITISEMPGGPAITLSTVPAADVSLKCLLGSHTIGTVVTVDYEGIGEVTATDRESNTITLPLSGTGQNGTAGFYTGLPVIFNGVVITAGAMVLGHSYVILSTGTSNFTHFGAASNEPGVTFVATNIGSGTGTVSSLFGGLVENDQYYVATVVDSQTFTVSRKSNPTLSDVEQLTTAIGVMTVTSGLPISPGQLNGQPLAILESSDEYANITGTVNNYIVRSVVNASGAPTNTLSLTTLSGGLSNVYVNMPFTLSDAYGGLLAAHTYYVESTGQIEVTVTNTSSSGNLLTCDSTVGFYEGMIIHFTDTLGGLVNDQVYYVDSVTNSTQFTLRGTIAAGPVVVVTTDNGVMTGTGEVYITVCDTAPGSAVFVLTDDTSVATLTQTPTVTPAFNASHVLGIYRVVIAAAGVGYAVSNTVAIPGTLIGGSAPVNNLVLTVTEIDAIGRIVDVSCAGTPQEVVNSYYFKVISSSQAELYHDALMTIPVNGYDVTNTFAGIVTTPVTGTSSFGNIITIVDTGIFSVNDEVIFTGFIGSYGNIVPGEVYYVKTISSTDVTISETLGGATFTLANKTGNCVMSKAGAYLVLSEPFYFKQSTVLLNNRLYQCVISNSDPKFEFSKWQELRSDSRKLNALDRIAGYYKPTANMPGRDLTQLVDGISYPNGVYSGNPFAPEESYEIDVLLQDTPFSPTTFGLTSVVWTGSEYVISANAPDYSATLHSADATEWSISKVAGSSLNVSDIVEISSQFVMTAFNNVTPVLVSSDGITWTTSGLVSPSISVPNAELVSVAYLNGTYVAVGDRIVTSIGSDDVSNWTETFTFYTSGLVRSFTGVAAVDMAGFTGFVVVGKGQKYAYPVGAPVTTTDVNLLMISTDGLTWISPTGTNEQTTFGLNAVAHNDSLIVAVGDNSARYYSTNGSNWVSASASEPSEVSDTVSTINRVVVNSTASLVVNSPVKFMGHAFGNIITDATYYVKTIPTVTVIDVTATTSATNLITCADTTTLVVGQPVEFTGTTFGNITTAVKYYVTSIPSPTEFSVSISPVGSDLVLTNDSGLCGVENLPTITISETLISGVAGPEFGLVTDYFVESNIPCYAITVNSNINDLINDGVNFVAVGDNGLIESSLDGIVWTSQVSGTDENLKGVVYNAGEYVVVGDNNTIRKSINLTDWVSVATVLSEPAVYEVHGDEFLAGYGPEELVPGVISDNLTMIINTRPGSNWEVQSHAHTGYNVVSVEITPT